MWFFKRNQRERDLNREIRDHLDLEAEEQRAAGLSAEDSSYAARRALGNPSLVKEVTREAWGGLFFETLGQDLRYAFRSLRGSPVFAMVAIVSLGLGIGANAAIFSFVNAILLKHLPVPEPTRLVGLAQFRSGTEINSVFSYPFLEELGKKTGAFEGILGRYPVRVNFSTDSATEPLNGEVVSGNYFSTLKVKPALGRLLTVEDVDAGTANPVCVISYSMWQGKFGGDVGILRRKLSLNSHSYTVIGVTEMGFFGSELQSQVDIQLPLSRMGDFMGGFFASGPGGAMWKSPGFYWLEPLARLKPGVTLQQAQAMVDPVAHAIQMELPGGRRPPKADEKPTEFRVSDGSKGVQGNGRFARPVAVLMGIVALVLLIACLNLANLLLARAEARSKEFAVRLSLGASRGRLVRQLMVESLVIAGGGGASGVLLSVWIIQTLLAFLNAGLSGGTGLHVSALNPEVLGFSIGLSVLTAALFGLLPAWQSARPNILPELKGGGERIGLTGVAIRRCLIVLQISLSLVILFAAGLMTRTLSHLKTIDLGFDPARVITLSVDPAMAGYTADKVDRTFDQILERLRAQPGITSASLAVLTPLSGGMMSLILNVPGHVEKSSDVQVNFNMISPDYFKTLNQSLIAGREFKDRDDKTAPGVAIVNELFARQYWPGQNPIGRHFKVGRDEKEIVGLVKNSMYQSLREKPWPLVYLSAKQTENSGYSLLVRTRLEERQAISEIEQTVRSFDSRLPIYDVQAMQDQVNRNISSERVLSFLSMLFSALTILLCTLGIYGLIVYSVTRRTREIGIRYAIGAQKSNVAWLFLRESLWLIVIGVLVGAPLALASTRALTSLLFGIEPQDVPTLILAVSIFIATGLLASSLPLRQATRITPLEALRYE